MTNAVSRVSSTTARERTIESAPTMLKARAMLSPITIVVTLRRRARRTSVATNRRSDALPRVQR
jgi:hypothetical protein